MNTYATPTARGLCERGRGFFAAVRPMESGGQFSSVANGSRHDPQEASSLRRQALSSVLCIHPAEHTAPRFNQLDIRWNGTRPWSLTRSGLHAMRSAYVQRLTWRLTWRRPSKCIHPTCIGDEHGVVGEAAESRRDHARSIRLRRALRAAHAPRAARNREGEFGTLVVTEEARSVLIAWHHVLQCRPSSSCLWKSTLSDNGASWSLGVSTQGDQDAQSKPYRDSGLRSHHGQGVRC